VREHADQQDDLTVTFYREHRPLDTYMNALLDAGFVIDKWHEVTETDKTRPNHLLPMFVDIVATKKPLPTTRKPPDAPQAMRHVAGGRLRRRSGSTRPGGNRPLARRPALSESGRSMIKVPLSLAALPRRWGTTALVLAGSVAGGGAVWLLTMLRP
jgi:hypothetical protein